MHSSSRQLTGELDRTKIQARNAAVDSTSELLLLSWPENMAEIAENDRNGRKIAI